ncbi:hypothetical protein PFISCL1PPCAC_19549, partial [Pristionchus fissidentatus]
NSRMPSPEKVVSRPSPYPLRDRSKKPLPFEVPVWASEKTYNTCIVDCFLSMLQCAKWQNPMFSSFVKGQSKFTKACKEFLDSQKGDMENRKEIFIGKLFKADKAGEFNLEGEEMDVILDKAKEASTISVSSHCSRCNKKRTSTKDYFYGGRTPGRSPADMMFDSIAKADRRHRCDDPTHCTGAEKVVDLSVTDETWMIPIDLSQGDLKANKISVLPHAIEIAGTMFRLTGVSLYSPGHYTCVLHDKIDWFYYDGIIQPALKRSKDIKTLVFDPICKIKIAYYLRSIE